MDNAKITWGRWGSAVDGALRLFWTEHTPHWTVGATGWASIRFTSPNPEEMQAHGRKPWLSIDAQEVATARNSSKRVMITLDENACQALADLLHEMGYVLRLAPPQVKP